MKNIDYIKNTPGLLEKYDPKILAQLVGQILQIWLAVKTHRNSSLLEFERAIFLPIHLNQFKIYHINNKPAGFVSWAYLTEELGQEYIKGDFDFKPEYWNIGKQLWFIDFIAPFGDARKIANELKTKTFPNEVAYAPLFDNNDKKYKKIKLHGINRSKASGNKKISEDLIEDFL